MLQSAAKLLLIFYIFLFWQLCYATDEAKEKRWAQQISDALLTGEAVWLPRKSGKFLAIYTENQGPKVYGAVILLHGIGAHPDWPEVIHPLRTELPEFGWSTLSIQMPVLDNDKKAHDYIPLLDEVAERINAAITFLKQKKIENTVIMGHSLGTIMSTHYLANSPRTKLQAYVGISMGEIDNNKAKTPMGNIASLRKINIPVLDIYGSEDVVSVTVNARARKNAAARAGNTQYQQVVIQGADHFYRGYETQLVKRIRSWLQKHVAGSEIKIK